MKRIAIFAFATFTTLIMASCASTSDSSSAGQYPVLKVLSDKPYVWDDSISEALNVARMAQPAGVGNGMRDFADGTQANTGRLGAGIRTFDAGVGLLSQGIFGLIAHESLSQGVNRQLDWKPAMVFKVNFKNEGEELFLSVREHLKNIVLNEIEKSELDVEFIGVGTMKSAYRELDNRHSSNVTLFFKGSFCQESRIIEGAKGLNMVDAGLHFLDMPKGTIGHCSIGFRVTTPYYDQERNLIVVAEMRTGFAFIDEMKNVKDSYLIVPDFFVGTDGRKAFVSDYARAYKDGKEYLFQK